MQRHRVFLAAALLSICAASSVDAATYDWSNTSGGTFNTAANWTPAGGPPGSNDTARFSLATAYTINFGNSATVNTLTQTQGDVTLNLNNATFLLSNTTNNGMGSSGLTSTLHISNGNFRPGNFTVGGNSGSTSNLFLDSGTATTVGFGLFYVGTSGTGNLTLQNGGTLTTSFGAGLGINSTGVGTATVAGADSLWTITNKPLLVGSFGTGTLNILATAAVTATPGATTLDSKSAKNWEALARSR